MAKPTLKATIIEGIKSGTVKAFPAADAVLHEGILYKIRADGFRRLPAQKQNRKRLGIVLAPPIAPAKVVRGEIHFPAYGRRAAVADFVRFAFRNAPAPAKI